MTRSEVAVKQDGHVHAVATPSLDGQIRVDADHGEVAVPPEVGVVYDGPDGDEGDAVETDGGVPATRSDVEMRGGIAMDHEKATWASILSMLGLLSAGYLWGSNASAVVAIFVALGAIALGWFATGSFWRWRQEDG